MSEFKQANLASTDLYDLRDQVRNLRVDLEYQTGRRNIDGEYIKLVEMARNDAEYGLANARASLAEERAKVKAVEERNTVLQTHLDGVKGEIGAVVIILKILRGLRPRQGDQKRGLVDKLVRRLEFWERQVGK